MIHKTDINYEGGFNALAEDLGNLTYDSLGIFLEKLAAKIDKDGDADAERNRPQLSQELKSAARHIANAWKICEPYMTI